MNDITRCPSHDLLVTYLYDECDPAERETIAAHLALCASCAEDVQGLRDARVHLAAWSPPALPLGFQLTRTQAEPPAQVLGMAELASRSSKSEGWWSRPLPAWAQAAAAVVIFAAGMSAGTMRSGPFDQTPSAALAPVAPDSVATVSVTDFERLDARLRSLETAQRQSVAVARPASGLDERALLERVSAMIDARVAQSDRQSISLLASAGRSLESYRAELAGRMDVIEDALESQRQDIQQVSRGSGYRVVNATSLLPTGR
jgi:hypothetical protein